MLFAPPPALVPSRRANRSLPIRRRLLMSPVAWVRYSIGTLPMPSTAAHSSASVHVTHVARPLSSHQIAAGHRSSPPAVDSPHRKSSCSSCKSPSFVVPASPRVRLARPARQDPNTNLPNSAMSLHHDPKIRSCSNLMPRCAMPSVLPAATVSPLGAFISGDLRSPVSNTGALASRRLTTVTPQPRHRCGRSRFASTPATCFLPSILDFTGFRQ